MNATLQSLAWIVGLGAAGTALLWLMLYLRQDEMLFYPRPLNESMLASVRAHHPGAEDVWFEAGDGTRLHAWLLVPEGDGPHPLVIYFGGNAEDVSWLLGEVTRVPGWAWLLVDYRGYGGSAGEPSERALVDDGLRVFDVTAARPDIDPRRIVLFGRSLGSGVVVPVAAQREVRGVVLVTPYDSIVSVAKGHYPFAPVSLLARHRFDSMAHAPHVRAPLLVMSAGQDAIIPVAHQRRLYDAWGGPKTWHPADDAGHEDVSARADYWPAIGRFLESLE